MPAPTATSGLGELTTSNKLALVVPAPLERNHGNRRGGRPNAHPIRPKTRNKKLTTPRGRRARFRLSAARTWRAVLTLHPLVVGPSIKRALEGSRFFILLASPAGKVLARVG